MRQLGGVEAQEEVSPTLMAAAGMSGNNQPFVVEPTPIHDQATRFAGKRGDRQDGKGNGLGVGDPGDPMNTLTAGDRHAVAYGLDRASFNQGENAKFDFSVTEEQQPTLTARGPGAVAHCTDVGWLNSCEEQSPTLLARQYKDPHLVSYQEDKVHYIVRRRTPTECARLQGFLDRWGDIDEKADFSDEEYAFWLEVRNTHAAINGKAVKDYTKQQMLNWYNKLQTDSSEYKMWGNGIALPPALYCMQGISEVLHKEDDDADALAKFPIRVDHYNKVNGNEHFVLGIESVLEYAEYLPTIDAVPVVRCAECIHRGKPTETDYGVDVEFSEDSKCPFNCEDPWYSMRMEDDFYCPIGERRSDD